MNFNNLESQADNDTHQASHIGHARANLQEDSKNKSTSIVNNHIRSKNASGSTTDSSSSQSVDIDPNLVIQSPAQTPTQSEENTAIISPQGIIGKEERKTVTTNALKDLNYDSGDKSEGQSQGYILPGLNENDMKFLNVANYYVVDHCKSENPLCIEQGSVRNEDLKMLSYLRDQIKGYKGDICERKCLELEIRFLWVLLVQVSLILFEAPNESIRVFLCLQCSSDFKKKLEEAYIALIAKLPQWLLRNNVLEKIQKKWNNIFQQNLLWIQNNTPQLPQKKTNQSQRKNKRKQVMEKARGIIKKILEFTPNRVENIWREYYKTDEQWIKDIKVEGRKEPFARALKNKKYCAFIGLQKFAELIKTSNSQVLMHFSNIYKDRVSENFFNEAHFEEDDLFIFCVILQVSLVILPTGESPTELIDDTNSTVHRDAVYFTQWMKKGKLSNENQTIFKKLETRNKLRKDLHKWFKIVENRLPHNSENRVILNFIWNTLGPFERKRKIFRVTGTKRKSQVLLQDMRNDETGKRAGHEPETIQESTKKVHGEQRQ